ncbi:cyclic di-GMP phosphodiesterase response regulator RpfG [Ruminiclostridium hungatei]|uniref:Cyclic di-GMP phosphodiesterase response regulator RpfG n=1 Tax=Ruminiclostridium hungatei TaxID=48256 RepID=A0A1V4SRJ8_RUMHU|nr:HD-GYP domain-containing protein [Ruminiclostridium hungatei]OPX45847.1 cyclic di-GMP phosphodiesterase response regulator RpfG [Ruminiclostridium hungatei]
MSIITIDLMHTGEGHVLAEDIYNSHGALLVAAYTTLNRYIIDRFHEFGIQSLRVFDPEALSEERRALKSFEKQYRNKVLETKELIREVIFSRKLDNSRLDRLAGWIESEVRENRYIIGCLSAIRKFDEYTYCHSLNVAYYSSLAGRWMNLSPSDMDNIIKAGLLHDIGKIRVPREILNKKGRLLPEEYEAIKKHSIYGFNMLEGATKLHDSVKKAVLMHHEREDGSGYPMGHSGEDIQLGAKIIAVADVYDAMTSERVYGKKHTPFEAFEMFMTDGMEQFDREVAATFIERIIPCYVGAKAVLNTKETGEVVYIPNHSITRPVVRLENGYIDLNSSKEYEITSVYF